MIYKVGQIVTGTLKEEPSIKANLLIIELRNSLYQIINIPCCISVKHEDEPFKSLEAVSEFLESFLNIDKVSYLKGC